LVEPFGFERAVSGEFVDDQVDEVDLGSGVVPSCEERVERCLCGGPVKPDDRSDEEPKAACTF